MDILPYITIAASSVMLAWCLAEFRAAPIGDRSRLPMVFFSATQGIFFLLANEGSGALSSQQIIIFSLSWLSLIYLLPAGRTRNLSAVITATCALLAVFSAKYDNRYAGLLILVAPALSTMLTAPVLLAQRGGVLGSVFLGYSLLSIISVHQTENEFVRFILLLSAGVLAGSMSFFLSKRAGIIKAVATLCILTSPYLATYFGHWLASTIHDQTTMALSDSLSNALARLHQTVVSEIDKSNASLKQVTSLVAASANWDKENIPWKLAREASERVDFQLSSLPGSFVYIADQDSQLTWSSAQTASLISAEALSRLAAKMRSRFRREGSPAGSFEIMPGNRHPSYVLASEIPVAENSPDGTIILIRPLYWIKNEGQEFRTIDFLLGPDNKILNMDGSSSVRLNLNRYVPGSLTLPSNQSVINEEKGKFLLGRQNLPVKGWSVGSSAELSGFGRTEKTALITTMILSAALLLAFAFSITPRKYLEIDSAAGLESKSPLRNVEDLANLLLSNIKNQHSLQQADARQWLESKLAALVKIRSKEINQSLMPVKPEELLQLAWDKLAEFTAGRDLTLEILPDTAGNNEQLKTVNAEMLKDILSQLLRKAASLAPPGSGLLARCEIRPKRSGTCDLVFNITHPVEPGALEAIKEIYDPSAKSSKSYNEQLDYILAIETIAAVDGELNVEAAAGIGAKVSLKIPGSTVEN